MAKDGRKPETRHIKKFMGGRMSPQDLHQAVGVRNPCVGCGQPSVIRIKVLVGLKELTARHPEFVAQIMTTNPNGLYVPTVDTTYGKMVKVSDVGACRLCQKDAETAAARGAPSWAIVEIDRGPGADRGVGQVPRSFGG